MRTLRLVMAVAWLGAIAEAAPPRFARPEVTVQVVLSDRVRPYQAIARPAGPMIGIESVLAPSWPNPIRTEQIQILEKLIETTPDSEAEEKADYLFRLAELFASQYHQRRAVAAELTARAEPMPAGPAKTKLLAEATAAANQTTAPLLRAVKTYNTLTTNPAFRNYPRLDLALFGYGFTLQRGNYMKEARAAYDQLLKNYPNSKYVPSAHLSVGDYYFAQGQLTDAEARYQQVLKFPQAAELAYATYKLGWVKFQLQHYPEALETWFAAARQAREPALHRAAALDFVRAYAEVGKLDKAFAAFERVDPAMASEMVETLAQLSIEQGKLDRASTLLRELVKRSPQSPRVCDWQYRTARARMSGGGTNEDRVREIEQLARVSLAAPQQPECRANAAAMSGELARAYHNEAQRTRNHETFAYAIRLYQAFVDSFPDDPRRPEAQYLQAEARWSQAATEPDAQLQREQWKGVASAFTAIATLDPPRATLARRAAVLAVLNGSADPALAGATIPTLTPGKPAPPIALTRDEQQLIDAIAAFAASAPRDPELGALRFFEGQLYRRANQHARAAAIFGALTTTHPDAPFAEAAAVLAIDSLILSQQLDDMLVLADRLAADARYLADKPELASVVRHVRSRSMRR